jgi:hypothetical protein
MSGVVEHGPESEQRQTPEADEWWQDSAFLTFNDRESGIGGVIRIGHEPNHAGGISALWFGLVTHDGRRFRRNTTNRLGPEDRLADGFGALDGRYRITHDGSRVHYRVDDGVCRAELTVEDFYPRTDFFPKSAGSLVEEFASSHFECSGAVSGVIELDDHRYEVQGLCHRDRSWGLRRWDTLLNHRWIPGTVGPELSFGSISWHAVDGSISQFGYVVRDGIIEYADEIDVVVAMEVDGTTFRGATSSWTFADGARAPLVLECTPYDAMVFEHHGVGDVDSICEVTVDGAPGFCDLEVSTNPRAGRGPVTSALRAVSQDGLSVRPGSSRRAPTASAVTSGG